MELYAGILNRTQEVALDLECSIVASDSQLVKLEALIAVAAALCLHLQCKSAPKIEDKRGKTLTPGTPYSLSFANALYFRLWVTPNHPGVMQSFCEHAGMKVTLVAHKLQSYNRQPCTVCCMCCIPPYALNQGLARASSKPTTCDGAPRTVNDLK